MPAIMPAPARTKIKIIVIGDTGVGKTSIAHKYQHGTELNNSQPTISFNIFHKKNYINNEEVEAQIWDTAGQERYHALNAQYYRNANAVIIVYDITRRQTFKSLEYWLRECENNYININVPKIIIGNKCDCNNSRQVTFNEGQTFAASHDMPFNETSKGAQNVNDIFMALLRRAILTNNYQPNNNEDSFRPNRDEQENQQQHRSYCFINNLNIHFNFAGWNWQPW